MKIIYFSKFIAAYDLKVGRCIEQNDLMNLHEYQKGQGHFLPLPKVARFSNLNLFFSETVEIFETKYHVKDFGNTKMKIYTNGLRHMTTMAARPIYDKNLQKSSPGPVGR